MTSLSENNSSVKIFLLDDDPIFRLGIVTALENEKYTDLEILAHTETIELPNLLAQEIPNVLLLSVDLIRYPERLNSTFTLCRQLHNKYPDLVIFLLTPLGTNKTIEKMPGVKGCCPKDIEIDELVKGLRICSQGSTYFQNKKNAVPKQKIGGWLYNQCKFGLTKVENDLEIIINYINNNPLSAWDTLFWKGRKRELIAARWLIYQLIPGDYDSLVSEAESENIEDIEDKSVPISSSLYLPFSAQSETQNSFDLTLAKIKSSVANCTGNILEIDILTTSKKKELLIIIINQLKKKLEEINIIDLPEKELQAKKLVILKDLWQSSTIEFLSRYYGQDKENNNNYYNLVDLVLKESSVIEEETLVNIPFIEQLLCYWLCQQDLKIDNEIYSYNDNNSQEIEEILIQNLILTLANSIMQFILNSFSDYQSIRYNLYEQKSKSSREITRFRNNLTWKYRQEKYWENPKNIFEDQYKVLKLDYKGIVRVTITHPRTQELSTLKGIPWLITMAIEFRDSIAKIVKGIGDIIGKSLVYILTEVIGKGIGLIGKGILQGIGKKIKS